MAKPFIDQIYARCSEPQIKSEIEKHFNALPKAERASHYQQALKAEKKSGICDSPETWAKYFTIFRLRKRVALTAIHVAAGLREERAKLTPEQKREARIAKMSPKQIEAEQARTARIRDFYLGFLEVLEGQSDEAIAIRQAIRIHSKGKGEIFSLHPALIQEMCAEFETDPYILLCLCTNRLPFMGAKISIEFEVTLPLTEEEKASLMPWQTDRGREPSAVAVSSSPRGQATLRYLAPAGFTDEQALTYSVFATDGMTLEEAAFAAQNL